MAKRALDYRSHSMNEENYSKLRVWLALDDIGFITHRRESKTKGKGLDPFTVFWKNVTALQRRRWG